jgi:hypothetical protein
MGIESEGSDFKRPTFKWPSNQEQEQTTLNGQHPNLIVKKFGFKGHITNQQTFNGMKRLKGNGVLPGHVAITGQVTSCGRGWPSQWRRMILGCSRGISCSSQPLVATKISSH